MRGSQPIARFEVQLGSRYGSQTRLIGLDSERGSGQERDVGGVIVQAGRITGEVLLAPREVAALLFVDPKTVTKWAVAGKLSSIRTPGGHRRYRESEVLAIISGLHPAHDAARALPSSAHGLSSRNAEPSTAATTLLRGARTVGESTGDTGQRGAAAAVVAEAVAAAMEEMAAEAAEEVLATSAAVKHAAERAAEAAQAARGAREFAAAAAAKTVAQEALRCATSIQVRADVAAARVKHVAAQAALDLARSLEDGTVPDHERLALLLQSTVLAAAEATAQETRRAAEAAADSVAEAAHHMARTVGAAEHDFGHHASAAASRLAVMCREVVPLFGGESV